MFARTERLLLRPGWIDDAPALAAALGHPLLRADAAAAAGPDTSCDVEACLAQPGSATRPRLLVFARTSSGPVLVGGVGLRDAGGTVSFGYWIHPEHRGRGYATEAGYAMIGMADMLGVERISAAYCVDNPASGAVLHALGFRPDAGPMLVRRCAVPAGSAIRHMIRTARTQPAPRALAA